MLRSAISYLILALFLFSHVFPVSAASRKKVSREIHRKIQRSQCNDRRDNDRDGLVDYPADPGCRNKRDKKEARNPVRTPSPTPTVAPSPPSHDAGLGEGASLNGARPFPDDNPWNKDISQEAIDPKSDQLIASIGIGTGLHPDFGTVWEGAPIGIPYVVVSGTQAKVRIASFDYSDESDQGPYPIPENPPIEGGTNGDGDRHILMIDRDHWKLYELFSAFKTPQGWTAGSGAIFDLSSNELRPAGWTSADAAGLPIFPGLVRYDEVVEQGKIEHALRFTVSRSRRAYVPPARHYASSSTDANLPPMGMRVRLKASYDISRFTPHVQVILRAMKKYGMFVADNGSNWYVSGAPDSRWDDEELSALRNVKGGSFEVVKMEGLVTGER